MYATCTTFCQVIIFRRHWNIRQIYLKYMSNISQIYVKYILANLSHVYEKKKTYKIYFNYRDQTMEESSTICKGDHGHGGKQMANNLFKGRN